MSALRRLYQFDGGIEHRPAGGKTLPRIVADLRIERDHAAREQEMRRRQRADVARSQMPRRGPLPRGVASGAASTPPSPACGGAKGGGSTAMRAANLTVSVLCGSSISIQVRRLPKKSWPSRRCSGSGTICKRGDVDALAGAVDRHQAQHVTRMRDRRGVGCTSSSAAHRRSRQRLPHGFGALVVGEIGRR